MANEFRTITVVIRAHAADDLIQTIWNFDEVQFAAGEDGVTPHALELGAAPADWDADEDVD